MKRAIIDVGSNSVRVMLSDGEKVVRTTALGENLDKFGILGDEPVMRTLSAIRELRDLALANGDYVQAFATEAVRSAKNGKEFIAKVNELVSAEILTGEEEALCGFLGAVGNGRGAVLDIGGASTEYCVGHDAKIDFWASLKIGIVRARDNFGCDYDALAQHVSALCEKARLPKNTPNLIGIGGTITSLAGIDVGLPYDRRNTDGRVLKAVRIGELFEMLKGMTVEEIKTLNGLNPKRADKITGGTAILIAVMNYLGASEITVSESDNLEGYISLRGLK